VVGAEVKGPLKTMEGLISPTQVGQTCAPVEPGICVPGVELNGLLKAMKGLVIAAELVQVQPFIVPRSGILGRFLPAGASLPQSSSTSFHCHALPSSIPVQL
ncbi:MAG: hypothetical protein V3W10_10070, partial [candidate division NC10 bacterium]